ncbi:hypothetical protein ACHAWO_013605 [Cyclotella atomus]|uniref:NTF2 domain-containing protein n=1 Tax=Cyclotella atomus TaxID=382360 RepID=A0ABD3PUD2_9STRA
MEDRHSISDPRPVRNSTSVEWEIDILRDETVIVDTFVLNNDVLPPRTNKKGKVLWKLPDTLDRIPAFGTEDRRRILDVFKDRKKKRKQEKKKRQDGDGVSGENGSDSPGKLSRNNSSNEYDDLGPGGGGGGGGGGASLSNGRGSNFKQDPLGTDKHHQRHNNQENNSASGHSSIGFRRQQSCPYPARPPPGLGDPHSGGDYLNQPPDPSLLTLNDPVQQNNQKNVSSATLQIQQPSPSPILAHDARFIIVPMTEMPDPLPGEASPSLAVPAARHFIASYYSYLENASPSISIGDLARYYTTKAQKSVSIGGAHSVVHGRNDITTQILSLAGSSFLVRGVVAQDAYDGRGVHILITGTAKTVCNAVAGGVLAFAHSVSLCPIDVTSVNASTNPELIGAAESGFLFQIHNDALALSGDVIPPTPQPSPPQQHPPPPPGLY